MDVIKNVGHDGHYLGEAHTIDRCRTEFWLPAISDRSGMEAWWEGEQQDTSARGAKRWMELLENYQEPKLDQTINKQIQDYLGKMLQ